MERGIIYLAEHLHLRKKIVLKKIKDSLADTVAVRQEADILKSLHHMYLPQVYYFFEYNSQVFTVIDYIEGYDLQSYIDSGVYIDEETLIKWMTQLCEVLEYLHYTTLWFIIMTSSLQRWFG
ncbi:MAG: protein kinase [Ruminococcus sp.]|nr:protein kinase [Ruminococcus sp.]